MDYLNRVSYGSSDSEKMRVFLYRLHELGERGNTIACSAQLLAKASALRANRREVDIGDVGRILKLSTVSKTNQEHTEKNAD